VVKPESTIEEVLTELLEVRSSGALNIYDEPACVAAGDARGQATARMSALSAYLVGHWDAPIVFVGEAPGKNGARLSGVPFTSMRTLTGSGVAEQSASIVHGALSEVGVSRQVLLWNASMLFPPENRDPTTGELHACRRLLSLITHGRTVYAIGRHAQAATGAPYLRHPANGGSTAFKAGVRAIFRSPPGTDIAALLRSLETRRAPKNPRPAVGTRSVTHLTRPSCPHCHLQLPATGQCGLCT
jgi:hypothetical protein